MVKAAKAPAMRMSVLVLFSKDIAEQCRLCGSLHGMGVGDVG